MSSFNFNVQVAHMSILFKIVYRLHCCVSTCHIFIFLVKQISIVLFLLSLEKVSSCFLQITFVHNDKILVK